MNKYIQYNFDFNGKNIKINTRSNDKSDIDIIKQVFMKKMFAIERFPNHCEALINYFNYLKNIGKVPSIFDAGANIGTASIYFSNVFKGSKIYSIEPDKENFLLLNENLSINNINYVGLNGALASYNGFTYLNTEDFGSIAYRTGTSGNIKIKSFALSDIIRNISIEENPFILKIDIEGAENEVFSVDSNFIESIPLIIMEPHDWMLPFKASSRNFYHELSKHNFDILMYDENIFCFNNNILKNYINQK